MNTFKNYQCGMAFVLLLLFAGGLVDASGADRNLVAVKTGNTPIIDGNDLDACWADAEAITTHDKVADIDVTLKALYSDKEVFLLVSFPDPDESRTHKSWVWDKKGKLYRSDNDIEDTFIFKWNMNPESVDLSVYSDNSYSADIWFWKACRTDPMGYADDKIQMLNIIKPEKDIEMSLVLKSKSGATTYLLRQGDKGTAAFKTRMIFEYEGDILSRFVGCEPEGSCKDVRAKGMWKDGRWTIEFCRSLVTGNDDDVDFDISKGVQFGISRYEIRGGKIDKKLSQPLYECGDVSESITLVFKNAK